MKRPEQTRPKISPRAFSEAEKIKVHQELNSERFQDQSPREVYATLMDEGRYLCSGHSMYFWFCAGRDAIDVGRCFHGILLGEK